MFSISDKIIAITGSNGLLGKTMTTTLRSNGATVIGIDIAFKNQTKDDYIIDITSEASVQKGLKDILEQHGRIDGWINNAYPRTKDWGNKIEDVPFDSWRQNVDMQLNSYFLCSKLVLEQMKVQGHGSLINMSSIYGVVAPDFSVYDGTKMTMPVAYSAIKGGLISLSRYLAAYYGPYNVRVNCISPGGIFDNQPEPFVSNYNKKVPLRRMGTSEDICSAAHFLLSDESSYITGHNLMVDGGWSII